MSQPRKTPQLRLEKKEIKKLAQSLDEDQRNTILLTYKNEIETIKLDQAVKSQSDKKSARRRNFAKKENSAEQLEALQQRLDQNKDLQFLVRLAEYRNEQNDPESNVVLTKFKRIDGIQKAINQKSETLATVVSKVEPL